MPVAATTRHEMELLDDAAQAVRVARGVARVLHFDAVEPLGDERLDARARAAGARVREHRDAARVVDHRDRVAHAELVLRREGGTSGAEVAIEGIARIHRPSVRDHGARHVRPPDRAAAGLGEHGVEGDGDA